MEQRGWGFRSCWGVLQNPEQGGEEWGTPPPHPEPLHPHPHLRGGCTCRHPCAPRPRQARAPRCLGGRCGRGRARWPPVQARGAHPHRWRGSWRGSWNGRAPTRPARAVPRAPGSSCPAAAPSARSAAPRRWRHLRMDRSWVTTAPWGLDPPTPGPPTSPFSVRRRKESLRLRRRLKPPSSSSLPGEPGIMLVCGKRGDETGGAARSRTPSWQGLGAAGSCTGSTSRQRQGDAGGLLVQCPPTQPDDVGGHPVVTVPRP